MITFFDVKCFLMDCWIWVKLRVHPDKRPAAELFAEVRERLGQMPAGKEIHEVFTLLDEAEGAHREIQGKGK